jgi:3-hydroxyisobutyrate dehydrogenase-like beta-hydroxyacid dehydrogenase
MGAAMATRLLKAGHPVTVWNRTAAKTQALAEHGATVAGSIAELAGRDIVFVMVSTPHDLEEVVLGEGGLLSAKRPAVIVDCSTVNTESSQQVRKAVTAAGSRFLAAPVSGNPHVVADGGAVLVASGPRETYDRAPRSSTSSTAPCSAATGCASARRTCWRWTGRRPSPPSCSARTLTSGWQRPASTR